MNRSVFDSSTLYNLNNHVFGMIYKLIPTAGLCEKIKSSLPLPTRILAEYTSTFRIGMPFQKNENILTSKQIGNNQKLSLLHSLDRLRKYKNSPINWPLSRCHYSGEFKYFSQAYNNTSYFSGASAVMSVTWLMIHSCLSLVSVFSYCTLNGPLPSIT